MRRKMLLYVFVAVFAALVMIPGHTEIAAADRSDFVDMPNDWSTTALEKAIDNGLLKGFITEGKSYLKPADNLTRAQMATIVNRSFGAVSEAALPGVTDVVGDVWFVTEMKKAVMMGTMKLDTKMRPDANITREEAFTILARALKLDADGEDFSPLNKFGDGASVSRWAKGTLAAMTKEGYIQGSSGKLHPQAHITRAEMAQVMHNIIKQYINQAGTVKSVAAGGNVMVNVADVTLENLAIDGDLLIGDGVANGDITLRNVTVTGRTVVRGGGSDSIHITGDSQIGVLIIRKVDGEIRIETAEGAKVEAVYIDDGCDDVILTGAFEEVVLGADIQVTAADASIGRAVIDGNNSKLHVAGGSIVTKAVVSAGAENTAIQGPGSVREAEVKGNNAAIETLGTQVSVGSGVTGTTAGGTAVPGGGEVVTGDQYSITFKAGANGAIGGGTADIVIRDIVHGAAWNSEWVPEIAANEGYTFAGWTPSFPGTVSKDLTFTANFTKVTYNISYNLNGGTVSGDNPATYDVGSEAFTLINPTKEGYTFTGWTGTGLNEATSTVTVAQGSTGDRSYTAEFTKDTYNISYNLNGGAVDGTNPTAYNVESEAFTLVNPTKEGYTFTGWTGTGLNEATSTVTVAQGSTGDRSYTAEFTKEIYNISYELSGGTVSGTNPTAYNVESEAFTLVNPTKEGYAFAGWTGTGLNKATSTVTVTQGSTGDRTYIAHFVDAAAPENVTVTPNQVDPIKLRTGENFVLTVSAKDNVGLYELEIDHSMEGVLPEFSVYADSSDPYGGQSVDFSSAGVEVAYAYEESTEIGTWTIDFGSTITQAFIDNGGITFYLVVKDTSENAWGSMSPPAADNTFCYTVSAADETAPTNVTVTPNQADPIKLRTGENFVLTVSAKDNAGLYELEIDHNMTGSSYNLPEFSVYADKDNPYGEASDKEQFENAGVEVVYSEEEGTGTWEIDFGPQMTQKLIEKGNPVFYLVVKDAAGNAWGSMSPTTADNTFAYTVSRYAPMEIVADIPTFMAGVPSTFTIGTVANDDVDRMVRAHFTLPAGITVEYQEGGIGPWIELDDVFGPASGFPLGDITTTFRGTVAAAGDYNVTVSFKESNGTVVGSKEISFTAAADENSPTDVTVRPAAGSLVLGDKGTFVLTVSAQDDAGLYELEIDHNMTGSPYHLPEFSVYADKDNPYGEASDKEQFEDAGVEVVYSEEEGTGTWEIDFGPQMTQKLIEKGNPAFYLVVKDAAGNAWGSMSPTTPDNTFAYTVATTDLSATVASQSETFFATFYNQFDQQILETLDGAQAVAYYVEVGEYSGADPTGIAINGQSYDTSPSNLSIGKNGHIQVPVWKVEAGKLYIALPWLCVDALPGTDSIIIAGARAYKVQVYAAAAAGALTLETGIPGGAVAMGNKGAVNEVGVTESDGVYTVTERTDHYANYVGLKIKDGAEVINGDTALVFRRNLENNEMGITKGENAETAYAVYGKWANAPVTVPETKSLSYKLAIPGHGVINVNFQFNFVTE